MTCIRSRHLKPNGGCWTEPSRSNWLLIFEHDPLVQAGYVRRDQEGKYYLHEVTAWQ